MELPLDRFFALLEAERRRVTEERKRLVLDTAGAIGAVFGGKNGLKKYMNLLDGDKQHGR